MKQNLQKSILFPFILFTIILTSSLVIWSSFFISHHFSQETEKRTNTELSLFSTNVTSFFTIHKQIKSFFKSKKSINSYLNSFPNSDYKKWVKFSTINKNFSMLTDELFLGISNKDDLRIHQSLILSHPYKTNTAYIQTNLNTYLKNLKKDPFLIYGILYKHPSNSSIIINTNSILTETIYNEISESFTIYQNNSIGKKKLQSYKTITFNKVNPSSSVYTFIATKYTSNQAIIKIVLGILVVILLSTIGLYLMYSLIIKKMTTSIDILRSVSKKVAKGNFDEKVFIHSSDEIGELSIAFNQMISQLKESTTTIIKQKEQSDAIIACIPDGIIVTDLKNKLIIANNKAEDLFNFQSKKNYLNSIDTCIKHHGFKDHAKQIKKKSHYSSEFTYTQNDSKNIFNMISTLVGNNKQKPIGIIYLIRDITHEKQLEELREGFLRTVSHELRTPLTSVIGFIELVMHTDEGKFSEEQYSCLKTALNEARSLKVLINDLLELSHMRAKQANLNYKSVNIYNLIENVTKSLYPLTKGKQLDLLNLIEFRNLSISVDEAKIRRILVNLISNGIKFTNQGTISVKCTDTVTHLEFCIEDTGIGLKDTEKNVIFEKFRQIDFSSTRQYEGIGLGLSIVKELVELHEGEVWVESTFGQGSRFYFTISKKMNLTATLVT
jgi:two-component system, OmpR family, phosphate regulon sensor histidine kinase PhoR